MRLSAEDAAVLKCFRPLLQAGGVRMLQGDESPWARRVHRWVMLLSRRRAVALGKWIFVPAGRIHPAVLAHELHHYAQFREWGALRYCLRGALARVGELLHWAGLARSPYAYEVTQRKPFEAYGMEQQGQIVEDAFRGDREAGRLCPYRLPTGS